MWACSVVPKFGQFPKLWPKKWCVIFPAFKCSSLMEKENKISSSSRERDWGEDKYLKWAVITLEERQTPVMWVPVSLSFLARDHRA
jgi:hypothetical protein